MLQGLTKALQRDKSNAGVVVLDQGSMLADSRATKYNICGFELEGVSIAGQETSIIIPRCKVVLDIGRCPQRAAFQQTVLFSHGHLDHIGGAPFHASTRCMLSVAPSKFIVPEGYEDPLRRYLELSRELQGNPPMEYEILTLKVGQEHWLASGFVVRPFPTCHPVPSQGYVIYSSRKKLRADLQGQGPEQIKALRAAGMEVTQVLEVPEIAFTGDTTSDFLGLKDTDDVFKARLLIMEMTFIDDSVSVDQAREKGHMHIFDFVANAHKFQNEAILLIHFSSRYSKSKIINSLNTYLPASLAAKCVPFLNGFADDERSEVEAPLS